MSKHYTFDDCIEYAKKNNMSFQVGVTTGLLFNTRYMIVCDAIDGYISGACYDFSWYYFGHCWQYKFNGNEWRTWKLKKNDELARRIASALTHDTKTHDAFNCCNEWFGM